MAELNQVSPEGTPARTGGGKKKSHYPYANADYGEGFKFDPDFSGPVRNRKCTDVLCLGLFLAFLGGWIFVGYFALQRGDIDKVIYPTDSHGRICGRGDFADRPFLLFFDLTKCLNPAVLALGCRTPQVCVEECPREKYSGYAEAHFGISLSKSQDVKNKMKPFCANVTDAEWRTKSAKTLIEEEICPAWVLPSTPVIGRCLPTLMEVENEDADPEATVFEDRDTVDGKGVKEGVLTSAVTALGAFLEVRNFGERVFNDLSATWWMIVVAFVAAAVISFLWIVLMRFFAGIMVWTSIFLAGGLFGGLFGYTLYKYITVKDLPSAQGNVFMVNFTPDYAKDLLALGDTWLAFTIILGIIFVVIVMILIVLRCVCVKFRFRFEAVCISCELQTCALLQHATDVTTTCEKVLYVRLSELGS